MASPTEAQADMSKELMKIFGSAIKPPELYNNNVLVAEKMTELKLCIDNALSAVLMARNAQCGGGRLKDELGLVFANLTLADILSASRVCKRWRDIILNTSALWATLGLYVVPPVSPCDQLDTLDQSFDHVRMPPRSNFGFVRELLPRSGDHLLTLDVNMQLSFARSSDIKELGCLLQQVAPRLDTLRFTAGDASFVGPFFSTADWDFPALRALDISISGDPYADIINVSAYDMIDFEKVNVPNLVFLSLPRSFRFENLQPLPALKTFVGGPADLSDLAALVLHSPALQSLTWVNEPLEALDDEDDWLQQIIPTLDNIPEVRILTTLGTEYARVMELFDNSQIQRLYMEFLTHPNLGSEFEPPPCAWTRTATHLAIEGTGDDMRLVFTQASGNRVTTIRVFESPTDGDNDSEGVEVQWQDALSLDSLTHLSVDAALWWRVMYKFPAAPRLQRTTLRITDTSSLHELLDVEPDYEPDDRDEPDDNDELLGINPDDHDELLDVETNDHDNHRPLESPTWLLAVPDSSTLTLSSETPVEIAETPFRKLKTCLGVADASLERVSIVPDE